ncbi:MAG: galactokinase family protein [Planctomycetota bacterium]
MEARMSSAPGRVTLLGEHVDHQGGTVLPVAINLRTQVRYTPQEAWEFHSAGHEPDGDWMLYVHGVLEVLKDEGVELHPGKLEIESRVPEEKGLSSSAALEVAIAGAVCDLPALQVAEICRKAEADKVGIPCGFMDQATSACAIAANVCAIDCSAHTFFLLPIPHAVLLLVDPDLPRRVGDTPYAERLEEVKQDGSLAHQHVMHEMARVEEGIAALDREDLRTFGALMTESHHSLRDYFRCSHPTLDSIVDEITRVPGIFGAKLVGAGWGGCVVALAEVGTQLEGTQLLVPDDGLYRIEA